MKRALLVIAILVLLAVGYLALFPVGQRADRAFDARVARPAYTARHPVVVFDEAHYNAHSMSGNFAPFANLLRNDGYQMRKGTQRFTASNLAGIDVLVIVNAAGGSNPKLFGFNLVPLRKGRRDAPAFTADEIAAVRQWVENGGSLLLVADHYPFGTAAAALASAFGITMHCGYTEARQFADPGDSGSIVFSRQNGLLADSPITKDVGRVVTFTGQSLDAPDAMPLLKLPPDAVEYVPPPPKFKEQKAGALQGAALSYGRGRVIVLGEAAMITAQISEGQRFGMNYAGAGNRQFVLNAMHWLSRLW